MVKLFFVALLFTSTLIAYAQQNLEKLNEFNGINAYGNFTIELINCEKGEEKIEFKSKEIDVKNINFKIEKNQLEIKTIQKMINGSDLKISVYANSINQIKLSAGAKLINQEPIENTQLLIDISTGSDAAISADVKSLTIKLADKSTLQINGSTEVMEAVVATGAKLYALDFEANKAKVEAKSFGFAQVNVTSEMDAKTSINGNIAYKGNPKFTARESKLGGKIEPIQ